VPLSRIDTERLVEASISANAAPFRILAKAFTMVLDTGAGELNQQAFEAVIDTAIAAAGTAIAGIGAEQSRLGLAEQAIGEAQDSIARRLQLLSNDIRASEAVDPYEATARINVLMTQLETSYSLTGRIGRLSLLNFL
jgi:flagellar hook-associated protein 3 FlgL